MKVKETFEIKEAHQTGHAPGLVVVLDTLAAKDPQSLVGRTAVIRTASGDVLHLCIDEAKEHGPVNSLFFRNRVRQDVPPGADIGIQQEAHPEPAGAGYSQAS